MTNKYNFGKWTKNIKLKVTKKMNTLTYKIKMNKICALLGLWDTKKKNNYLNETNLITKFDKYFIN